MTDKIYLVGFMASGKSTLARALSERLHWRCEDIDELIEARERQSITEIFQLQGEPYFRTVEREMLAILQPMRQVVVATGGFAPLIANETDAIDAVDARPAAPA